MTAHAPEVQVRRPHVNLWLAAVIAVAAALVALAAWVLVDRSTGPDDDATTLIDGMNAAWSAGDAATVASLFTENAVLTRDDGGETVGSEALGNLASWTAANLDFQVERVAPVSVEGDFATTLMEYTSSIADGTQVGVYQFEEGKILRFWLFKLGATPPFDNAVIR